MVNLENEYLRTQLEERRYKLQTALAASTGDAALAELAHKVDAALDRMDHGTYGLCEACHESVEKDRLLANPLETYCIDHLTPEQRSALQDDLDLAARIQRRLLPPQNLSVAGWETHYHYAPARVVSGDYCDLIQPENGQGDLFFLLGDVSGKGVGASMLMSQLHAMFRTLTTVGLPLEKLMEMANRVFCEGAKMADQYATLVCGRASRSGEVELAGAGHVPALWLRRDGITTLDSAGVPLGMFCDGNYPARKLKLELGESLFLYSDGVSELRNQANTEYGLRRLVEFVGRQRTLAPSALTTACLRELETHAAGRSRTDDLTILVLRRAA